MNARTTAPCNFLAWDTDFFHCRIGRLHGDTLTREQVLRADEWSRDNRIQCLYFLARAGDPDTIRTAEESGFRLVDIRVTLEHKMGEAGGAPGREQPSPAPIRAVRAEDLTGLQELARAAHTRTRFFSDRHFPRERAEALYATWIALECQGSAQKVLVAVSAADQPLGYVSCHFNPAQAAGQIGLVGVTGEARGRSLGKGIIFAALDWFATQAAKEVTVVTQGNNLPAQRLYQRCGFLVRDLQLWYHKWYPAADSRHA
jgi:RimJ/RimL family protein N-acetyltransferase